MSITLAGLPQLILPELARAARLGGSALQHAAAALPVSGLPRS